MIDKKIGIIGCGNMGEALLSRLVKAIQKSTNLMVTEMDAVRRDVIETKYKMIVGIDNNYLVKYSDIIIIAVKPKDFDKLLKEEVCCGVSKDKLIISLAAGITTKYIEKIVGKDIPVVRAMPNMGALVGESITAISGGKAAGKGHLAVAREIFENIGDVIEVEENLVDSITAVSGSGPAYFFYLMESLIEAAEELGLDKASSERLVYKTALGSARLVHALKAHPLLLRGRVTSKGGTTEAAFKIFESRKFKSIVKEAVKKAAKRAKELARG